MSTETPVIEISDRLNAEMLGAGLVPEPAPKRKYTMSDKVSEALKKHSWKKGQSGNPKGRPIKNLSLVSLVKERLETHPEEAKAIALALITLAKGKDMRAIEELLNRIDGRVAETHRIEGELPIKLIFVPASQVLARDMDADRKTLGDPDWAIKRDYEELPAGEPNRLKFD